MITVELDRQTIERLIEEKNDRIIQLDGEMVSLKSEVERLQAALRGDIKDFEAGRPSLTGPGKTISGRAKYGESKRLIAEYLANHARGAMSPKELAAATGVNYNTAFRAVQMLAETKKIMPVAGKWIWAKK
jgi:hypothetical protein